MFILNSLYIKYAHFYEFNKVLNQFNKSIHDYLNFPVKRRRPLARNSVHQTKKEQQNRIPQHMRNNCNDVLFSVLSHFLQPRNKLLVHLFLSNIYVRFYRIYCFYLYSPKTMYYFHTIHS